MSRHLQRSFHPGGFFQDEDSDLRKRDFNEPTGEDREIDRTLLPEVMQVKKFGFKGRTKWTHLSDQDTSGYHKHPKSSGQHQHQHQHHKSQSKSGKSTTASIDNPWLAAAKDPKFAPIVAKHKMGGVGGGFSRPSKKPKKEKAPETPATV